MQGGVKKAVSLSKGLTLAFQDISWFQVILIKEEKKTDGFGKEMVTFLSQ